MGIRFAIPADAAALLAIYRPYVLESTVSFEYEAPTEAEFARRIAEFSACFPYLVYEIDGQVVGYVYAAPMGERAAYSWSVDSSIYVDRRFHRRGVAAALYRSLFALLKAQGIHQVYACITLPNPQSEAFHLAQGFATVGCFPHAGYKAGAWVGVFWMCRNLLPFDEAPTPVMPVSSLEPALIARFLQEGNA